MRAPAAPSGAPAQHTHLKNPVIGLVLQIPRSWPNTFRGPAAAVSPDALPENASSAVPANTAATRNKDRPARRGSMAEAVRSTGLAEARCQLVAAWAAARAWAAGVAAHAAGSCWVLRDRCHHRWAGLAGWRAALAC